MTLNKAKSVQEDKAGNLGWATQEKGMRTRAPPTSSFAPSSRPFMSVVGPHLKWPHHRHGRVGRRCKHRHMGSACRDPCPRTHLPVLDCVCSGGVTPLAVHPSLTTRLPSFFGGYAKESAFFRIATEKAGKPGDEAIFVPHTDIQRLTSFRVHPFTPHPYIHGTHTHYLVLGEPQHLGGCTD